MRVEIRIENDNGHGYEIIRGSYDSMPAIVNEIEYRRWLDMKEKWFKLQQPVDKRTKFYKYLVERGIVEDGQTIYNKDVVDVT